MNNSLNVMLVTNSAYILPTITTLFSLFENNPVSTTVYIFYSSLKKPEIDALTNYSNSWAEKTIIPVYIEPSYTMNLMGKNGYPKEMYYRILGIDLLPETLEKVLYLDVDILIKGDVAELYNTDITGSAFAVCEDIYAMLSRGIQSNKQRTNVPASMKYFNSGIMLFNLDYLRKDGSVHKILNKISEKYDEYLYVDQDALNELYYADVVYVPWTLYNCPPRKYIVRLNRERGQFDLLDYSDLLDIDLEQLPSDLMDVTGQIYDSARIIHYAGHRKPWKDDNAPEYESLIFEKDYSCYAEKAADLFIGLLS